MSLPRALVSLALLLAAGAAALAQEVVVRPDDPRGVYAPGQTAGLVVESGLRGELAYTVRHSLRTDPIATGTLPFDASPTTVPVRYDSAAFLTVEVSIRSEDGGEGTGAAGVAFGRGGIGAFGMEPADFDAFWTAERAALDAVPLDVQLGAPEVREYSDVYAFSAAQLDGRRVYGHIVVPRGEGVAAPFPATLRLPPFGGGANVIGPDVQLAERTGCLAVSVNIHDAPSDAEDPNAYEPDDPTRREGVYYRYAVAAARRAIDVIAQRDDWNGRELCVYGDSQGGGLAFLTAAVDARVTHLMQAIAALSQHGGDLVGRPSGFPYYLETAAAVGDDVQAVYDAVSYYDAAFAARRFAGPSLHFVNYLDDVCPPATVYAAHNELTGPRVALHSLRLRHNNPEEFTNERGDFLREHFVGARTAPFPFASERRGHFVDAGADTSAAAGATLALAPAFGFDGVAGGDADWSASWEVLDAPGAAAFDDAGSADASVTFDAPGTYRLRLRVTDPYPEAEDKWWELTDDLAVEVVAAPDTTTTTATRDLGGAPALLVSPNPAATSLTLRLGVPRDILACELRDAAGRLVAGPAPGATLDVASVAPGTYFALARTRDGATVTAPVTVRR